jgi:hypothetical protein
MSSQLIRPEDAASGLVNTVVIKNLFRFVLIYLVGFHDLGNTHCYQVNDCSSKILVIKGRAYFLRHCQPFSNKILLLVKGGMYFFQYKKYCSPFTNKSIFSNTKRNVLFSVQKYCPPFSNKTFLIYVT